MTNLKAQNLSKRAFFKSFGRKAAASATFGLALLMGSVAIAPVVQAQATEGRQFGSAAGNLVNEALTSINNNQFNAAITTLNQALALPDLNPYERSIIYQMQGQSYYEMDQSGPAISAFENAVNAGGLLPDEAENIRLNIAQLMIGNGQYAQGAQMLENFINQGGIQAKPEYVDMLVGAWVEAQDFRRALPWAERWFNAANPKERKHFDLLNFLYNNLGMSGKQADIVLQMINRYPEDTSLWNTWASMLANGGRESDAFEVNKMLYLGGALNDTNGVMKVVQYYSYYDMPFQAAKILEREMNAGKVTQSTENLILLSNLLRQAREYDRAIPVLERAAQGANTGKIYADLGEALYNNNKCDEAENAFRKSIDLGYPRGKAWSQIANCRYEESQQQERIECEWTEQQIAQAPRTLFRDRAREAYKSVPARSAEGRDATTWIRFIDDEATAVERRCEFEKSVEREECYQDIELSYKNMVFTAGELVLSDPAKCSVFIPAYDREFRVKIEG